LRAQGSPKRLSLLSSVVSPEWKQTDNSLAWHKSASKWQGFAILRQCQPSKPSGHRRIELITPKFPDGIRGWAQGSGAIMRSGILVGFAVVLSCKRSLADGSLRGASASGARTRRRCRSEPTEDC
jgi:hypothetical protein